MMKEKKQINIDIGKRIREYRNRIGMTREELAERVDISPRFEADIERGSVGPSLTTLKQFCMALGVSSDSLLWDSGVPIDLNARLRGLDEKYWPLIDEILAKQVALIQVSCDAKE